MYFLGALPSKINGRGVRTREDCQLPVSRGYRPSTSPGAPVYLPLAGFVHPNDNVPFVSGDRQTNIYGRPPTVDGTRF